MTRNGNYGTDSKLSASEPICGSMKPGLSKPRGVTFSTLVNVVRRDVDRYKEKFKSDADRRVDFSEKPSGEFEVYKSVFPSASVKCTLDLPAQAIVAHYAFTRDDSRPPRERWQRIELRVDAADNIELRSERRHFSNLDEVSRFLLEPVLFLLAPGRLDSDSHTFSARR